MLPTTLERLRVFHAIATTGTVAGAARQLGYTPSAVSQHLSALEREARTALVERSNRGVVLTVAGRLLADRASEVLDVVRNAFDEVASSARQLDTTLRVAAFPTAISALLAPLVSNADAQVHLEIVHAESEDGVRLLVSRSVDAAITDGYAVDAAGRDDLHRVLLRSEPIYLVTRSPRTKRRLADFADSPWVLGGADSPLAAAARRACREAGFSPKVVAHTDDHHVTFDVIRATGAAAFLPELALRSLPPGIAVVRAVLAPLERRIELICRASMRHNVAITTLADRLLHLVARSLREDEVQSRDRSRLGGDGSGAR
jgi:DNA-binding transcriptional LysR family regulator